MDQGEPLGGTLTRPQRYPLGTTTPLAAEALARGQRAGGQRAGRETSELAPERRGWGRTRGGASGIRDDD